MVGMEHVYEGMEPPGQAIIQRVAQVATKMKIESNFKNLRQALQ